MSSEDAAPEAEAGRGERAAGRVPKRTRGTSFPSLALGDAVTMIKKIAIYGNTHTDAAVASFLGHSTSNSGPYRSKIAALKDFGFLSGRGDELTVTPLALEITHPGLDADVNASLRAAFLKCSLFLTVYTTLPKDTPLDIAALANSAMHNHGVASQSKDTFASVFVKSGITAGLLEEVDAEHVRLLDDTTDEAPKDLREPEFTSPNPAPSVTPARPSATAVPAAPLMTNAVVNHVWPIAGGVIRFVIESSTPLPANAYGVIGAVIGEGDKLAEMLGNAEVSVALEGDSE